MIGLLGPRRPPSKQCYRDEFLDVSPPHTHAYQDLRRKSMNEIICSQPRKSKHAKILEDLNCLAVPVIDKGKLLSEVVAETWKTMELAFYFSAT